MGRIHAEIGPDGALDEESPAETVALLTAELVALRGEVEDLRRRLHALERGSGRGLSHPSEFAAVGEEVHR